MAVGDISESLIASKGVDVPSPVLRADEKAKTLIAYEMWKPRTSVEIAVAPREREWSGLPSGRSARHCLPLAIASQLGWQVLNPTHVQVNWDGGAGRDALSITGDSEVVRSLFGAGTVTWVLPYLFRTPPNWDLWVRGPANQPKDGVCPLEGIVETSWSVAPFTMSWKFTRAGTVAFRVGEPVCQLVPIPHDPLRTWNGEIREAPPDLRMHYDEWLSMRRQAVTEAAETTRDRSPGRHRHAYTRGVSGTGISAPVGAHSTRLEVKPFSRTQAIERFPE